MLPSDLDGSTLPPAGAPNYFVESRQPASTIHNFHVDWTTPANTIVHNSANLATPASRSFARATATACRSPARASKLDGIGDRLMFRLAYRNFGDHESLVVNHTVDAGGGVGGHALVRDPQPQHGTPTLYQQGTYAPDSN